MANINQVDKTLLLSGGRLATMQAARPYGLIDKGALLIKNGRIAWLGPEQELPAKIRQQADETLPLEGRTVTPGLVDCHSHLVYASNRAAEFEMRLKGVSYQQIAQTGGGIRATVTATRAASNEVLLSQALKRLDALISTGVTTLEIKSGYGLNTETEIKMLQVASQLAAMRPVTIQKTFLGAHSLPPEFVDNADGYIDYVCHTMLPKAASLGLVDAVDVFCENIAFNIAQTERVFKVALNLSLPIKCHAEQLSHCGATELAARYGALSADHLEYLSEAGARAMAKAGTVAVLLPGAYYFLKQQHCPAIDLLRRYQVPMALATDSNPGSSPCCSLLLMLNMACTLFGLSPEEALAGVTRCGATALGLGDSIGTLEVGKQADLAIWDIDHPAELAYFFGFNPGLQLIKNGLRVKPSQN